MWPYSGRCLTVPISSFPYCNPQLSHISDHQHEWRFNYSCSKHSSTTKKRKASSTKSKPRNAKSTATGELSPHWNKALLQTKMGKGLDYPENHLLSRQTGGDSISRHSPWGAGESLCLHSHCAHSRGLVAPLWRQDFRNARWTAFFF